MIVVNVQNLRGQRKGQMVVTAFYAVLDILKDFVEVPLCGSFCCV